MFCKPSSPPTVQKCINIIIIIICRSKLLLPFVVGISPDLPLFIFRLLCWATTENDVSIRCFFLQICLLNWSMVILQYNWQVMIVLPFSHQRTLIGFVEVRSFCQSIPPRWVASDCSLFTLHGSPCLRWNLLEPAGTCRMASHWEHLSATVPRMYCVDHHNSPILVSSTHLSTAWLMST